MNGSNSLVVEVTPPAGATLRVAVRGEVDLATAEHLRASLIAAIDDHAPERVVIDAAAMSFLDAAGMTALIAAYRHAYAQDTEIRMVNVRPLIGTVLGIAGLTGFLRATG